MYDEDEVNDIYNWKNIKGDELILYRQTQMNDEIFRKNLKQTVIELKTKLKINCES